MKRRYRHDVRNTLATLVGSVLAVLGCGQSSRPAFADEIER